MILNRFVIVVILFFVFITVAQAQISGIVFDQASRKRLAQVELSNLTNQAKVISSDAGEFVINAQINDVLVFRRPGYRSDTVLITNLKPLRRYMVTDKNTLKTVVITDNRSLREQYAQAFNKANPILLKQGRGLLFYPSSIFSREGKQARYFVRMIKREEKEKIVDRRFNLKTISALLPIKQPELDAFYILYKPSIKFAQRATMEDFKSYVLNCYEKFKLLPPEKRILPSLKID